jgi:WD40 repeat protein
MFQLKKLRDHLSDVLETVLSSPPKATRFARAISLRGPNGIESICFSPDGARIVCAGGDKDAWVLDLGSGSLVYKLGDHGDWVRGVAYASDGARIVSVAANAAQVWNARTGEKMQSLQVERYEPVRASFSPDGAYLVTAGAGFFPSVVVWDVETANPLHILRDHPKSVFAVSYAPDGAQFLVAGMGAKAHMYDHETGHQLFSFGQHLASIYCATFSSDGGLVATGSDDATAIIWDSKTRRVKHRLKHHGSVTGAAFSPNGDLLATASWWDGVKLWDVHSGRRLQLLSGHPARDVQFSQDGTLIAAGHRDGNVRTWRRKNISAA